MSINTKEIVVADVMLKTDAFPIVREDKLFKESLELMNSFCLGIACIVDSNNKLLSVITDGDIRRILLKSQKPFSSLFVDDISDYSSTEFKYVSPQSTLKKAVSLMGECKIWDLPVTDSTGKLMGLLHLHPAIKAVLKSYK